jgi:hypothetical protein
MRKSLVVFLVLALSVSFAFGQHRTGDKAILFAFDGLSFMNVYEYAGGLGFKSNMGDLALRAALMFGNTSIEDIHQSPNFGDKQSQLDLGLDLSLLYALSDDRVAPYVGLGFGFGYTKYKESDAHASDATTFYEYEESGFSIGVGMLLGVEVFVVKNLSLSGEYQLGFTSASLTSPSDTGEDWKAGGTSMGIQTAGILILSAYF